MKDKVSLAPIDANEKGKSTGMDWGNGSRTGFYREPLPKIQRNLSRPRSVIS